MSAPEIMGRVTSLVVISHFERDDNCIKRGSLTFNIDLPSFGEELN